MSDEGPLSRLYSRLWRRTGGRPWTHIAREWSVKEPLAWLLAFATLGAAALAVTRSLRVPFWAFALAFSAGIVVGHIWW